MFLNDADIEQLTGRKRPADQLAWLRARGYRHDVNGQGRPVVARAEVEAKLVSGVAHQRRDEPNWSALRKTA